MAGENPFAEAVRAALPPLFERCYVATVISQSSDGTLEVRCADPKIGELAKVPLLVGCPEMNVTMRPGDVVRLWFAGGKPDGYFATAMEQNQGATKGVARVGDLANAGTVTVTSGPGAVTITYTAPGSVGPTGTIAIVGQVSATPTSFGLKAVITSGHPDVMLTSRGQ